MIGTDVTGMSRRQVFVLRRSGDTVYRLYDASEILLYVGIAGGIASRFEAHRRRKSWWPDVAHRTAVWYGTRIEALSFEALAIATEKPIHNLRKDHPLPIKADGLPGGWIHMIPELTLRANLDGILAIIDKHNLTIGVAARRTQACRALLLPADWYRTIGEAAISELEK